VEVIKLILLILGGIFLMIILGMLVIFLLILLLFMVLVGIFFLKNVRLFVDKRRPVSYNKLNKRKRGTNRWTVESFQKDY